MVVFFSNYLGHTRPKANQLFEKLRKILETPKITLVNQKSDKPDVIHYQKILRPKSDVMTMDDVSGKSRIFGQSEFSTKKNRQSEHCGHLFPFSLYTTCHYCSSMNIKLYSRSVWVHLVYCWYSFTCNIPQSIIYCCVDRCTLRDDAQSSRLLIVNRPCTRCPSSTAHCRVFKHSATIFNTTKRPRHSRNMYDA